jgi:hypothetical protein
MVSALFIRERMQSTLQDKPEASSVLAEENTRHKLRLNLRSRGGMVCAVRLGKTIVLLLLAIWLPTTAHCGLEAFGVFPMEQCCKDEAQGNHKCDSGCSVVEDGGLKAETSYVLPAPPDVLQILLDLSELPPASVETGEDTPPFETQHLPQFVIQTALPIRGPSFAS